ncbi:MAG: phenylalanine--tRNA ligase subunit alpha [Verrucomicrobiia bacterium]
MPTDFHSLRQSALTEIASASDTNALEQIRVALLGKKGSITALAEEIRTLPPAEKPAFGQQLNELRGAITRALEHRQTEFASAADARSFDGLDLSLPGKRTEPGTLHPLTQLMQRAIGICRRMGFALATGPCIETEFHCFDALNTPADHPARNEQDTFYFSDGRLLRTHTSSVQIRTMERVEPPLRIIAPGAAFRRDEIDATHSAQFHQLEGLYVNRKVSVADLKGTLDLFFRELLGGDTELRFRPHFFPFTEPSFEIDVRAASLGGRWLEMGGCGMVDPAVFEAINVSRGDQAYDPEVWTGFAFGMGLDRLTMILFGIPDIRFLAENDLRMLRQFAL